MPRFLTLACDAQVMLDAYPTLPDGVRAVLMAVVMSHDDMRRYQFLRERFGFRDMSFDGTYIPVFPDNLLQRAKTLDQSVDNAMRERQ